MRPFTRRGVLGGAVGVAGLLAGCSESESGAFTETTVDGRELVVEFEESLEAESISVIDPDGEAFAETDVSAGASRVTFEIPMPYSPGEYRIVAADSDESVAETTETIRPELEIVDVGVGANRMDEMPDSLGHSKRAEGVVTVENVGSGPELVSQLQFKGDLPNPRELDDERIGIYDPELEAEAREAIEIISDSEKTLYSRTLPFTFEGDGIDCSNEEQSGQIAILLRGEVSGEYIEDFRVEYGSSDEYNECEISIEDSD